MADIEMLASDHKSDMKAQPFVYENDVEVGSGSIDEIADTRRIQNKIGVLRKAREFEEWMDRKLGVESQVEHISCLGGEANDRDRA